MTKPDESVIENGKPSRNAPAPVIRKLVVAEGFLSLSAEDQDRVAQMLPRVGDEVNLIFFEAAGADMLACADIEEGVTLRRGGIRAPILVSSAQQSKPERVPTTASARPNTVATRETSRSTNSSRQRQALEAQGTGR